MNYLEQRQSVIKAGLRLVAEGLIARTWGNVSVRLDDNHCAITPSGRSYAGLKPEDIVIMNIHDLSYAGPIVPSSEKAVHAAAYKLDDSIKAVIHTHQLQASTVAAARRNVTLTDPAVAEILGASEIRCASYALPGTVKLARACAQALRGSKACLMAGHGVLCVGASLDEAFEVALRLEDACESFIASEFEQRHGSPSDIASRFACYLMTRGA
ncbi:MAG: L-fuculose phosphate aldolase [Deltaproteobacteria bacterium ADurb.Bin510]|nr:MAG: L-fuculose phosphate aldolase [Deltaproteobacteria bacterium ADurb.Bin510]